VIGVVRNMGGSNEQIEENPELRGSNEQIEEDPELRGYELLYPTSGNQDIAALDPDLPKASGARIRMTCFGMYRQRNLKPSVR
jgi:hypothetical protein